MNSITLSTPLPLDQNPAAVYISSLPARSLILRALIAEANRIDATTLRQIVDRQALLEREQKGAPDD